jgi:ferredoxin--NADP+ reductase
MPVKREMMFEVLESEMIVPNIHLLKVKAPEVAREMKAGQFVILRADDDGERIPLNVSDWDPESGTITIIFMNAGSSTNDLAAVEAGMTIPTVVGPLGNPTEIDRYGSVMLVGGCYGIGSILPIARALKEAGNKVIAVVEARSSYLFYWDKQLAEVADGIVYITRDGTKGYRGHVGRLPEIIAALEEKIDRIIINGCTLLLRRGSDASRPTGIKTIVALNPIMMDGTGMCGVCRVTVGSETKFACVDGPDFDGHEVDWTELLQRRRTYMAEEVVPTRTSRCEEHAAARTKEPDNG